jgi:Cysteine dioxygenase type I
VYLHPTVAALDLSPPLEGPPLPPAQLAAVTDRFAEAAALWRPLVRHHPDGPGRRRLLSTGSLEVWLLGWSPGQRLPAHDHGGGAGAFTVVDGLLVEDCLDHTMWTTCRRTGLRAGARTCFGPDHVHVLGNPGPTAAVSVHACSPPGLTLRAGGAGGRLAHAAYW